MQYLLTGHQLEPYHRISECSIVPVKNGGYGVLDNGIQTLVATSNDLAELRRYIGDDGTGDSDDWFFEPDIL